VEAWMPSIASVAQGRAQVRLPTWRVAQATESRAKVGRYSRPRLVSGASTLRIAGSEVSSWTATA
jgi:hypothetical protein